jgi:zeaxanthin epoxidase
VARRTVDTGAAHDSTNKLVEDLVNKLVVKLVDRASGFFADNLPDARAGVEGDFDNTMLGKPSHLATNAHPASAVAKSRFVPSFPVGGQLRPFPKVETPALVSRQKVWQQWQQLATQMPQRMARMSAEVRADAATMPVEVGPFTPVKEEISHDNPLRVIIAGAGIGGLALADNLVKDPMMQVTVLEKTEDFRRFGGPIQLASNALAALKELDDNVYGKIMEKFTLTGDKENGIKDGIRDEWYAKFDLKSPAEARGMELTGVIERPDLQEIYLDALPKGVLRNGDGVDRYETNPDGHGVKVIMQSGAVVEGDVLLGADGIWSQIRSTMRNEPAKGEGSGVTYSGYTVFAGELTYPSHDNGQVGYKVYIGPEQYFVITDIGKGRYQWYAFLVRDPDSVEYEPKPDGSSAFLRNIFLGWSQDIHHILNATKEHEIAQRDLYDLPPQVRRPWTKGPVALLGDSVHAMMPNLGQGGGQAIEDAFVISQELKSLKTRNQIADKLNKYRSRRLVRSASVQGLSRVASDLIISTFDTPAKIVMEGGLRFENFNYNSIVTRMIQPILPLFFSIQFNFLYEGWKNELAIDLKAALGLLFVGGGILLFAGGFAAETGIGLELGLESFFGTEGVEAILSQIRDFF